MSEQLDIFATPLAQPLQRAHRRDAPTSLKAARKFHAKIEGQGAEVLALIRRFPGLTPYELAHAVVSDAAEIERLRSTICRRAPELERKGLVRRGAMRDCTVKHTGQTTWGNL